MRETSTARGRRSRTGSLRKALMLLVAVAVPATAACGQPAELETDRDSFTLAPTTTSAETAIVEASYSFVDNRTSPTAHSYPELLLQRGIGERAEARLGFNAEVGGPEIVSGSEFGGEDVETEDESCVLYGVKIEMNDQQGWLPGSAAVIQAFTPVAGPSNKSTRMLGEAFGWRFAAGWEWTTAIRYGTGLAGIDAFDQ